MRQVSFKLLEFNVYDDNIITENSSKYRDNREFMVQVFGINEKGETASIFIEGYTPFFYVKVDDTWDESKKTCFINEIKNKVGTYYEDSIVKAKLVSKKTLYGFDAGKLHNFVQIVFKNTMALNRARKLWYDESYEGGYTKTLKPDGYVFEETPTYLYESNFPPLLRLFHIKEISPSGWIALPENHYLKHKKRTTTCTYEYTINYRYIISLNKNNRVPYKQCSFDIEASSSHGDFPVPIKNYKKLAIDIVNKISKTGDNSTDTIKQMILASYGLDNYPDINKVFTKKPVTRENIEPLIEQFNTIIPKNIKLSEEMDEECEVEEPEEDEVDDDENIENMQMIETGNDVECTNKSRRRRTINNKTVTIIDILQDDTCEYKLKVKELCKSLTYLFPPLEGDRVTFIGSTIKLYGDSDFALKHCIVLNGCTIPEQYRETHIIECYETEREVLLAWQQFIQRENPDIITGYNINGFDFNFMYKRSRELKCTNEFLKLSRNRDEICINRDWRTGQETIETTKIVLASGEYNLKYIKMTGRLVLDLYIYFRREYQLSSYKLDHTASQFICDDVKNIEHITSEDGQEKTIIYSKNLKGINPGDYINFEEISYSTEYYKKGKKFIIRDIDLDKRTFTIDGREELNMDKKVKWGIAKDDVPPQEIFRLSNGDDLDRGIVAMYCIKDCRLVQDIIDKMDLLTGFIEMSNYCSVPMSFLLFRGQGIKLQSYVGKKCREKDTLMPTLDKSDDDSGYEGAIVLEPKTDIYLEDPVACVDYSSLYPSSMISENISHDSKVWTREYNLEGEEIKIWGEKDKDGNFKYDNLEGYTYIDVVYDTYEYIRKTPKSAATKVRSGYKICRFAQLPEGKSIMPSILEELLGARKATKRLMNKAFEDGDLFMGNIYEKRQLTIKVTANSLYGQCGAKTSVFYDKDVAASTTAVGRKLLIYARDVIETAYKNRIIKLNNSHIVKTNAEYVYGDSVASYTPVYIRVNNNIEVVTVDSIVEKYGNGEWCICREVGKQDKEFCDLTKNSDLIIYTWTESGWTVLKTVIRHRLATHKKMFRILTHTGLVDVTDDHSLLTNNGNEISPNDLELGCPLMHKTIEFTDIGDTDANVSNIDIERAKIYGFFFGDGSCGYYHCKSGKKASWALNNKNPVIINKYLELCKSVYPEFEWQVYDTIKSSNVYKIVFNNPNYGKKVEFIRNFRKDTYHNNHKVIPQFIMNSSVHVRMAFWEGLYDADGDRDKNGYTRIDQKSQISAANIALLANSIGYKTSINTRKDKPDIYRITCTKNLQRKNPDCVKKITTLDSSSYHNDYVYDLTTENHHFAAGIGNMIVHNTDSVFFKFNLKDTDGNKIVGREALEITIELAKQAGHLATKFLKRPHDLEYEKTFMPFILLSKKRYVGMLYEDDPDKGKIKFMGIVLKRRDNAAIVKDIYGGIIDKIVKEKSIAKGMKFCRECLQNMVDEKYPIEKLIVTKSLRGYYKNPKQIAHNVLADRIGDREQGNRPLPGDRIEYAYIKNPEKKALQGDKIETPNFIRSQSIKIDYSFYITNQIMKPILQLFALAVEDMVDLKKKYGNSLGKWYRMLAELQEKWPEEDKFVKKCEELKCKEVKSIIFDPYLNMLKV